MNIFTTMTVAIFCIGIATVKAEVKNDMIGKSTVLNMKASLPIETPATGTIVSITSPDTPLCVTTDMGDIPEHNMRYYAKNPETFKNAILGNFPAMGEQLVYLATAAYNAGIQFSIHIISSSYPDGFSIYFTLEELGKGLTDKK